MDSPPPPAWPPWIHRGLAIAWIVLLWLPAAQMVFRFAPAGPALAENRRRAAAPRLQDWSWKKSDSFRRAFEEYFKDRFGFRDFLIRVHNLSHLRVLRTTPLAKVVVGRGGWLYHNGDDEPNLRDYSGLEPFTEADLDTIEKSLAATRDALRRRGVVFAFLVAPDKHTLYPEHLPERIRALAGTTRLDQLADRLSRRPDILFVDVRRALLEEKARHPLYFRTDTHWNSYGAHLAARQLTSRLAGAGVPVGQPGDEGLVLEMIDRPRTDLAGMLGLSGAGNDQDLRPLDPSAKPGRVTVLPRTTGKARRRENTSCETGEGGPRFLLVQDSFGRALFPALCRRFPYGVSVWETRITQRTLERERPDVVILEIVERRLGELAGREVFLQLD